MSLFYNDINLKYYHKYDNIEYKTYTYKKLYLLCFIDLNKPKGTKMKFLIIILSLILFNSCSTYDRIIDNAGDAYDWSKEKAKDTVEGVKEVISE